MSTITNLGDGDHDYVTGQHGHNASPTVIDVPLNHLVDYVLGNRDTINPKLKIYVNADNPEDFVTYDEARRAIRNAAVTFREEGLNNGDCVCIHSYNNIQYPLLWLSVIAAGGIVTGSNPANTTQELVHHFSITNTKFVIAHADRIDSISEATEKCSIASERVFVFGNDCGNSSTARKYWRFLFDFHSEGNENFVEHDLIARDNPTAAYATTSGTTGLPKAAELTHHYFIAQLLAIQGLYTDRNEEILRQLHCLPVFHAFAAPIAVLLPLRLGITTYYLPRFHSQNYVNAVFRFQITDTAVVPPIIAALTKLPPDQKIRLLSLRFMICAGAPLATVLQSTLSDGLHPDLSITQCWGCTETGWISAFRYDQVTLGSVGHLLPNTILKIVDHESNVVTEDDHPGEAYIKSQSMLKGYRTSEGLIDRSKIFDKEGFYATGDIVRLDQGKIFIQGRIKDIMKVNGWQVSPDELQSVIMQLAPHGVADCAVMGCTYVDIHGLEITKPRAYIVRCQGSEITADDIRTYVKRHLVSYKQITRGVVFVDQIPRNPTGKILRRLLHTTSQEEGGENFENLVPHHRRRARYRYNYNPTITVADLALLIRAAETLVLSVLLEKLFFG